MRRLTEIQTYVKERDAMLRKGSVSDMLIFMEKHGLPLPSDLIVAEITLHKAITSAKNLPIEQRRASKKGLLQRGCRSQNDGDV